MSKQFSEMTLVELREYAEMVQAEYDAGELEGPSGRQIVRDAWARVEEAEAVVDAVVEAPATYTWDDTPPSAKEIAWERFCRLVAISDALHARIVALDIRTDDYFDKVIHLGNRALRISQEGARIEREYGFTIR
jgi:FMN phosphatase YigB (HAD superfamily)